MTVLLLSLLAGCWKPYADLPQLDFDEVPYSNPYLEADDAVISAFDTTLKCPDGEDARFFAVYRTGLTDRAPVAIVLHSGAFDYVVDPDPNNELDGTHYAGDGRLDRGWANSKVWETLGINPNVVDPSEVNLGTLPAALTDAGFVQLYPGNCWGDLWHNNEGEQANDLTLETFDRNGLTFAEWMIRMIVEPSFASGQGFSLPVQMDSSQVYLVGLGSGGRGAVELLFSDNLPIIPGVLLDSTPDTLSWYVDHERDYPEVVEGLRHIFREDYLPEIDRWSALQLYDMGLLPERTGFVWSAGDTRQPAATMETTADLLAELQNLGEGEYWSVDVEQSGHVFLNGDPDLARTAVDYLLTGSAPQ